jgi:hypothetical protein
VKEIHCGAEAIHQTVIAVAVFFESFLPFLETLEEGRPPKSSIA